MSEKPKSIERRHPVAARADSEAQLWRATLSMLQREFLERPLGEVIQPLPALRDARPLPPKFVRVAQVGKSLTTNIGEAFAALQNALTSCHAPGKYSLLFALSSDGAQNSIYLGVQSHNRDTSGTHFLRQVVNFLEGNLPGTRFVEVEGTAATSAAERLRFQSVVQAPLQSMDSALAITGVPSIKSGDRGMYPQTLDRLLNGMRGQKFLYLIVAEPMEAEASNRLIDRCRLLKSAVHSYVTTAETLSRGEQVSASVAFSTSVAEGTTLTNTESEGINRENCSLFHRLFETLGVEMNTETLSLTSSHSVSENRTDTTTHSTTTGVSSSLGKGTNREYLNSHALAVEEHLSHFLDRFKQSQCWNVGAYLISNCDRDHVARQAAMQLRALLTGGHSYHEPIRAHDLSNALSREVAMALERFEQPNLALVQADRPANQRTLTHRDREEHLLGESFSGLTTPLNTEELALLVNLPQREVAGVPLLNFAEFSLNPPPLEKGSIVLGHLLDGGNVTRQAYAVPPAALAKHTLVAGINGSGKSTTVRRIVEDLLRRAQPVPFLLIEPAKTEYVTWARAFNRSLGEDDPRRISIFTPCLHEPIGGDVSEPLALNPLEVLRRDDSTRPNVVGHIDRVKTILISAFPEHDVLPLVLAELIDYVYQLPGNNWLGEECPPPGSPFPTLKMMLDHRDKIIDRSYEMRIRGNISAAIKTRLQSLRLSSKRDLFDPPSGISTDWRRLFERPAVVNLSGLEDDMDKCLAMSVLLMFLYEYRRMTADEATRDVPLRHLTVVEEAHRIMMHPGEDRLGRNSPQGRAAAMFAQMLSEVRAYGEGFVIADQVPGRLIADAIKNTNLKIVHRLVANDDREAMAGCMTMTEGQQAMFSRLRPGQAFVFGDQDDSPAWVQIAR